MGAEEMHPKLFELDRVLLRFRDDATEARYTDSALARTLVFSRLSWGLTLSFTLVLPAAAQGEAGRLEELVAALLVERNRVVAEGAGAAAVAVALAGQGGPGPIACLVSGGNIDIGKLAAILRGELPGG